MLSASVSNLDLFRVWKSDEDLDLEWLLRKLRGEEPQSEAMKAGEAFHKALETAELADIALEWPSIGSGEYRFDFNCDATLVLPKLRELRVQKEYDNLLVRGRVDGLTGKEITDYKTTSQFDPDRLLSGYQWRFYLDMTGCDVFVWQVFVLREFGPPGCYDIREVHELKQMRYPGLEAECQRLAHEYAEFAEKHLAEKAEAIA